MWNPRHRERLPPRDPPRGHPLVGLSHIETVQANFLEGMRETERGQGLVRPDIKKVGGEGEK